MASRTRSSQGRVARRRRRCCDCRRRNGGMLKRLRTLLMSGVYALAVRPRPRVRRSRRRGRALAPCSPLTTPSPRIEFALQRHRVRWPYSRNGGWWLFALQLQRMCWIMHGTLVDWSLRARWGCCFFHGFQRLGGSECQKGSGGFHRSTGTGAVCAGWRFHVSSLTASLCGPPGLARWAFREAIWGG